MADPSEKDYELARNAVSWLKGAGLVAYRHSLADADRRDIRARDIIAAALAAAREEGRREGLEEAAAACVRIAGVNAREMEGLGAEYCEQAIRSLIGGDK